MAFIKQSAIYTRMFLLVQSSDHITGLTGASPAVTISKAGGAFGAAGGTITEVANGFYKVALTTTDTNTLGDLAYHVTAASADPTDFVDQVLIVIPGDPVTLTTGERDSIADALLNRDMSIGTDSGSPTVRTVRQALRFLRNKWTSVAGTLTVYKENDTTTSWTSALATDTAALPIISSDPAG